MKADSPILEFDPELHAILEPRAPTLESPPDRCVLCFFQEVLEQLTQKKILRPIGQIKSEIGPNPLYLLEHQDQRFLVVHPGVGAPLAAGFLEEIIAMGIKRFIACGGCGVLDKAIAAGHPLVITSAVRDEGTSYHYLPSSREVTANPQAVAVLETVLKERGLEYRTGKAWTTDAIYRETAHRRDLRVAEGCSIVEMEAAALFAVAQFRGVTLGQLVYGGDLVVPEGWDKRAWYERTSDRELLFWLAVEACGKLS
ncbi:MAG TPA: nucleoside phosphorylase [Bellilinea sp.]|nr:nucleoside phosphorylase [Bellilinea sp.]